MRLPRHTTLCSVLVLVSCHGKREVPEPQPLARPAALANSATASSGNVAFTSAVGGNRGVREDMPALHAGQAGVAGQISSPVGRSTVANAPVPELYDASGAPLPQTEDVPTFDSPSFKSRVELLFRAIVTDNPALAAPAFFPVVAYEQVKAIANPKRDHEYRLLVAFARNIREYHRQLGKNPESFQLIGMTPPTLPPRWMKPGTEGNRLGYYRLLRSQLRVADAKGTERSFEVTSMISWRGEWYVVHLSGFK